MRGGSPAGEPASWNNSNLAQISQQRHRRERSHPPPWRSDQCVIDSSEFSRRREPPGSTARRQRRQRLVHDPPDGARAPPALRAAAEAAVDLTGRARRLSAVDRRADVAGRSARCRSRRSWTRPTSQPGLVLSETIDTAAAAGRQKKNAVFTRILICRARRRHVRCDYTRELPRPSVQRFRVGQSAGSGRDVGQRLDDAVDHLLDQHLVVALAHHADHRLGAGGADDQAAAGRRGAARRSSMAERTLAFSSGLPLL